MHRQKIISDSPSLIRSWVVIRAIQFQRFFSKQFHNRFEFICKTIFKLYLLNQRVIMGGCCGGEDLRPKLKINIIRAEQLPRLDGGRNEIEAFCKIKYGPAKAILSGSSTGIRKAETEVVETSDMIARWDEEILFPVASLTARYSLEISVWDKDSGDNDLGGISMLHYSQADNDFELGKRSSIHNDPSFLPEQWNKSQDYELQLEQIVDEDGVEQRYKTGKLFLKCEFVNNQAGGDDDVEAPLI